MEWLLTRTTKGNFVRKIRKMGACKKESMLYSAFCIILNEWPLRQNNNNEYVNMWGASVVNFKSKYLEKWATTVFMYTPASEQFK